MNLVLWTVILVALFIVCIFIKKLQLPFVMFALPLIIGLLTGAPLNDLLGGFTTQFGRTMTTGGLMMLFSMIYFSTLTETGFFNRIATDIFHLTKGKMNVWVVMAMTFILMTIGKFTGSVASAWFMTFPLMIPFYDKMKFSRIDAMTICCLANGMTSCLPWATALVNNAAYAGVELPELIPHVTKLMILFVPMLALEMVFFANEHKKNGGQTSVQLSKEELDEMRSALKDGEYVRPNRFFINLIVFLAVMALVVYNKIPAYVLFAFASVATFLINYPNVKEQGTLLRKCAFNIFNAIFLFAGVSMYVAVLNTSGMTGAVAETLASHISGQGVRIVQIVLLLIMVPFVRLLPYQIYDTIKPIICSLGVAHGYTAAQMIAPFIGLLGVGTAASPLTATTVVGTGVLGVDANEYSKRAVVVSTVAGIIYVVLGLVLGLF